MKDSKNKKNSKKKDAEKLLSWKETWQVHIRALRLIHKSQPGLIMTSLMPCVWSALTPYAGIWLMALILDELAGSRNPERLLRLVLATLLSAALFSLVDAFLKKRKAVESESRYYYIRKLIDDKILDMDFCIMDDPETSKKRAQLFQSHFGGAGWGLNRAFGLLEDLFTAVFTLTGGIALTVTLFTARVPDNAGALTILNSPLFVVLIMAVMLAVTYVAPMFSNKSDSYFAFNSDTHALANRLFGYYGFMGHRREFATDMRIYRQDLLCGKFNSDKTGTFSSQGYFARLARGPMGAYSGASRAVSVLFTGIAYLFVGLKAWAGAFGVGLMTQYVSSIVRLSDGVSSLIGTAGLIRINGSFVRQFFDFMDCPNVMYQGSLTVEKRRDRQYEIEFRDVSFRYPRSEQYALRHVNMKFKVGSRIAVVGENGSDKTTFIKLLCRLYDPTEGTILLNGIDIRKYSYPEYLSVFSVVFQDFALTALPLGQNVASAASYDREATISCLKKAGFGDRLDQLPKGLDTYLGKDLNEDGVDMSGGEKQKIALARALYKDAAFIVLDEPTAALDPIAEAEIYSRFNAIIEDKTAIYISHRLSSCKFCDDILVFDKGSVIQQGRHDALVADAAGKYHALWHAQAQYYDDAGAGVLV